VKWYKRLLSEAGFGTPRLSTALGVPIVLGAILGMLTLKTFSVLALAFAVWLLTLTVYLEWLRVRAKRRISAISAAWPEVIESLVSAFQAGLNVSNAIDDLAAYGPSRLRKSFALANQALVAGHDNVDVLSWLKVEFSTEVSDRTIEILKLLDQLGGHSSIEVLSSLAHTTRSEISFQAQLDAKQGWVSTTAKLALIAPWVVVLMLSRRPENAVVYNSPDGMAALLVGLGFCLLAYLAIQLLGTQVKARRVFADAN